MVLPDFTLKMYEQLCRVLLDSKYVFSTVHEYLSSEKACPKTIIFRHDIDRTPVRALHLAQLEQRIGVKSTYYFRSTKAVFQPDIIGQIVQLGHEIGYHYETLAECNGDYDKAISLFAEELARFRDICPVTTISMHGRPLSKFDNRNLWEKYDFRDYGLIGECYLSIDYNTVLYLSDTGRTWHPTRYNVRDQVKGQPLPELDTTGDLINYITCGINKPLCLLTHPNRWTDSPLIWGKEWLLDQGINQVKRLLITFQHQSNQ